jgi:glycerophosphoryl diester phosphodiesterase
MILIGAVGAVLVIGVFILVHLARSAEKVECSRTAWLRNTLIAHKGLHNDEQGIAENSISAFIAAIEKGYPIELDISLTKDNIPVVYHDKKLKRMFGIDNYLKDMTYQELSQLKFHNSNETVPLFSEVLSLINGKVPLLVEIKNDGKVGDMESLVYSVLKNYKGLYAIQSFNPYTVKWFRKNAPDVLRGQLSGSFMISDYELLYAGTTRLPWYKKFLLSNLLLNFESKPNFIAYQIKGVKSSTLKSLKKLGVLVLGWTVDEKSEYQRVKGYFDNFIVNNINIL